jgi:outer membrane protein/adhesin transport system outer membrane protein
MTSSRARLSRQAVRSLRAAALILPIAMLATPFLARSAAGETLTEALAKAYNNNPQLLAARAQLRATDEGVPRALSGWRPTVTVNSDAGPAWSDTHPGGTANYTPRSASLQVTQPLYTGDRTSSAVRQAESLVLAQRSALASVEQNVLLSAATAYMDVVRAQAVLELNRKNEQVIARDLEATRTRFEVGELTKTDVAQAESRLAGATAARIQAEGQLESARATYAAVIGDKPGTLETPPPPTDLPGTQDETVAGSDNAPNVIAAQYNERAARDGVDVAFSQLLPSLALVGEATTADETQQPGIDRDTASIVLQLTVPLYQAGAPESDVRQSKQVVGQRQQELENERRTAVQTAISAWQALATARAQIKSFESQVEATRVALEGVRLEAEVGARTVLDILDAEQEYLDAQVSLVGAKRDEVVASYQVLSAVGRLTARDLALPVQYYDVESYYREVRNKFWGTGPSLQ